MKKDKKSKIWNGVKRGQKPEFTHYANYRCGEKGDLEAPES